MPRVLVRVMLSTALLAVTSAMPARAQNTVNERAMVTGVAEVIASTCPWEPLPVGTECVDTFVIYFQEAHGQASARKQPWRLAVIESRVRLVDIDAAGNDTWELLNERWGDAPVPTGHVDTVHMLAAQVTGVVPMSAGPAIAVDLEWDMTGTDVNTAGNDGPAYGLAHRHRDRCSTENFLQHQRWREGGHIDGSIGGMDLDELYLPDWEPFVSGRSVFNYIITKHGPSC